jgi:polar amino acid transport system substrate-binding protein
LKVYITPNWPPFDIYTDGKLSGIGIEFWKLIAKKAHIDYVFVKDPSWSDILNKIKTQQADVTPNTSETEERKKFAYFSKTYISFPLGIVCKNDEHFNSISDIKTVAVGKNFTAEQLMKKHYPDIEYVESKNTIDALYKVVSGEAQCAVDILPALMWNINQNSIQNLILEFKTPFKFDLKVMLSKKDKNLLYKINNAILSLTDKEKRDIVSKYSSVILIEKNVKSMNVFLILFFVLLLAVVIIVLFKFKKRSETDEMTKVFNRATMEREFKDLLKKSGGSVLFMDLDRFKHINDTYGHEKGDYVLKEFSKIVSENIRSSDLFGRWGGEEFVLVFPKTDYVNAFKKAETIRKKIEEYDFGIPVTVSIGVSDFEKGENLEEVIKRADENVYKAKRGGRNRVIGKKQKKD